MVAPLVICTKLEQRAVIRFLWAEGFDGTEIHRRLTAIYGGSVLPLRTIYGWIDMFRNGRTSIKVVKPSSLQPAHRPAASDDSTAQPNIEQMATSIMEKAHQREDELDRLKKLITFRRSSKSRNTNVKWIESNLDLEINSFYGCGDESNASSQEVAEAANTLSENNGNKSPNGEMIGAHQDGHSQTLPNKQEAGRAPKPQTCQVCGKVLSSASSYYVHMKLHSGSKPFQCTQCEASFCRKPYLEVHMRSHTGERPFQCDVCFKRFTQKSSLNTHKRVHTGERPYECDICQKRFAVKSYVSAHRWSHVAEKPLGCNQCNLTFTSKTQFTLHMRTHMPNSMFDCHICGRSFVRDSYLIRHHNRVHRDIQLNYPELSCQVSQERSKSPNFDVDERSERGGSMADVRNLENHWRVFERHMTSSPRSKSPTVFEVEGRQERGTSSSSSEQPRPSLNLENHWKVFERHMTNAPSRRTTVFPGLIPPSVSCTGQNRSSHVPTLNDVMNSSSQFNQQSQ